MLTNYVLKAALALITTPLTNKVVSFLEQKEHEDYFDKGTNFALFNSKFKN